MTLVIAKDILDLEAPVTMGQEVEPTEDQAVRHTMAQVGLATLVLAVLHMTGREDLDIMDPEEVCTEGQVALLMMAPVGRLIVALVDPATLAQEDLVILALGGQEETVLDPVNNFRLTSENSISL